MALGFSALGAIYLAMLFVPNAFWARAGARPDPQDEPLWLRVLERVGQVGTTVAASCP